MAEVDALSGRRARRKPQARAESLRGPNRARSKAAAAIGADIAEVRIDAIGAKGALVRADHRLCAGRRKVLVAIFAIGSDRECHAAPLSMALESIKRFQTRFAAPLRLARGRPEAADFLGIA